MMGAAFYAPSRKDHGWDFAEGGDGYWNQGRMVRRLEDDAEREWGSQMESGRMEADTGREHCTAPGGGCVRNGVVKGRRNLEKEVSAGEAGRRGFVEVVTMVD